MSDFSGVDAKGLLSALLRDAVELKNIKTESFSDYSEADLSAWDRRLEESRQLVEKFNADRRGASNQYRVQGIGDDGRIVSVSVGAEDASSSFYVASIQCRGTGIEWVATVSEDGRVEWPGESAVDIETVLAQPEVFLGVSSVDEFARVFDAFVSANKSVISEMLADFADDIPNELSELLDDAAFELKCDLGELLANHVSEAMVDQVIDSAGRWVTSEVSNSDLQSRVGAFLWMRGASARAEWDECRNEVSQASRPVADASC